MALHPSHAHSPSPPPPPPVALTPGPRASQLQTLFSTALAHTLKTASYQNFSQCFPTPATQAPHVLKSIWEQITKGVEETAKREFEEIMAERDVVRGLNELERLVGEAKGRRERGEWAKASEPPHTLPPSTLYLAHLAPCLSATTTSLTNELSTLQTENVTLASELEAQREEVEVLVKGLENVISDLEHANAVMGDMVEGGELDKEILEVEGGLRLGERGAKL